MAALSLDRDTEAFLLDPARLQQFVQCLDDEPRIRVRLERLWGLLANVYGNLPFGPERHLWLMVVLEELAGRDEIELPVRRGRQWDHASSIPLPKVVTKSAEPHTPASLDWRTYPWHPRLQWVLGKQNLSRRQFTFLVRVNVGLVEGWFDRSESFKYRSLQLTGDEKRLEALYHTSIFGPGCLTLSMLGCETDVLPIVTERFSPAPTMLIFENATPFMVARTVMARLSDPAIGRLAYGAGKQVLKSSPYFGMIDPPLKEVYYIGDLDAEGVQTGAALARQSTFVPVLPATKFHLAMLESASQLGAYGGWPVKENQPTQIPEDVIAFLGPEIRERVCGMIEHKKRIPEEVLSMDSMGQLLNMSLS